MKKISSNRHLKCYKRLRVLLRKNDEPFWTWKISVTGIFDYHEEDVIFRRNTYAVSASIRLMHKNGASSLTIFSSTTFKDYYLGKRYHSFLAGTIISYMQIPSGFCTESGKMWSKKFWEHHLVLTFSWIFSSGASASRVDQTANRLENVMGCQRFSSKTVEIQVSSRKRNLADRQHAGNI